MPYKEWKCTDVIDLAEGIDPGVPISYEQCAMYGNEKIRYAHIMKHPDIADEIHIGCVCAEKMNEDYVNACWCETALKNRMLRRNSLNKVQWNFNASKGACSKNIKANILQLWKAVI